MISVTLSITIASSADSGRMSYIWIVLPVTLLLAWALDVSPRSLVSPRNLRRLVEGLA